MNKMASRVVGVALYDDSQRAVLARVEGTTAYFPKFTTQKSNEDDVVRESQFFVCEEIFGIQPDVIHSILKNEGLPSDDPFTSPTVKVDPSVEKILNEKNCKVEVLKGGEEAFIVHIVAEDFFTSVKNEEWKPVSLLSNDVCKLVLPDTQYRMGIARGIAWKCVNETRVTTATVMVVATESNRFQYHPEIGWFTVMYP